MTFGSFSFCGQSLTLVLHIRSQKFSQITNGFKDNDKKHHLLKLDAKQTLSKKMQQSLRIQITICEPLALEKH